MALIAPTPAAVPEAAQKAPSRAFKFPVVNLLIVYKDVFITIAG
jgi:hypothetical protein